MIEVNRSLYMDESTGEKSPQFKKVQQHLQNVLQALSRHLLEQPASRNTPSPTLQHSSTPPTQVSGLTPQPSPSPFACVRALIEACAQRAALYGDRDKERALCLRSGYRKEKFGQFLERRSSWDTFIGEVPLAYLEAIGASPELLEAAFEVDLAHFKTSRQQPTAIPQLYYSPCTPPFSPSYYIPGKPQKRSAAIRAIMQILLNSEDPRGIRTTESANSMLTFSQYNIKLLERTPSGGHFEIRITRFLPQMVINKKARVALGRLRKSNVCFRVHCKKDPADTPQEDSLIQQAHDTEPSDSDLEKGRCRRRLGQSTSENCASQYASKRIHLKMSDGTAIVAKWTYLSSSDVSAEILEPEYLAGRQISSSHIPCFAMPVGNWYYKDFAVTERAYAAMQSGAEELYASCSISKKTDNN